MILDGVSTPVLRLRRVALGGRARRASVSIPGLVAAAAVGLIAVLFIAGQPAPTAPAQPAPQQPISNPTPQPPPEGPGRSGGATAPRSTERAPGLLRFGRPEPLPRVAGAIRLASYNVENLFDDQDDPALSGGVDDLDDRKPDDECEAVAKALRAIDADVVALQEVESEAALRWFIDKHLDGLGYTHVVSLDAGDGRGIEQSVISRFPLRDVANWPGLEVGGVHPDRDGNRPHSRAGKPITFARSPLRVTVDVPAKDASADPAYTFTLFVVHLKSGPTSGYWREREAAKLVSLVGEFQGQNPDANVFVVGDFNARPGDGPIDIITRGGLFDAFGDRPRGDSAWITHSSGRVIDFIFATAPARPEIIPQTRFVLATPTRAEGVNWRTTPNPIGWASDHFPLVIDLTPADR